MTADEDSRSEHSSVEEGKEESRLLLKKLKVLEVSHPTVHPLRGKPAATGTDWESVSSSLSSPRLIQSPVGH
jgi:hypothetical protein